MYGNNQHSPALAAALEAIKAQAEADKQRKLKEQQPQRIRQHQSLPSGGGKAMYNFMRGMP